MSRLAALAALLLALPWSCARVVQEAPAPGIGAQREAVLFWPQERRDASFRRMYEIFPSHRVAAGVNVHPLPPGAPLRHAGEAGGAWLSAYMEANRVSGLMVLQGGRVRFEGYGLGMQAGQRWTSFSVAKSVTSLLLGIALERGLVHDLADPLPRYIPELAGSAYAEVTVAQLLTMTSGVRWNEDYADPRSDVAQMYLGACVPGEAHVLTYLKALPRQWPAGSHWNYNTAETDLLGVLVQRATGMPLAHWLAGTVWQPWGMAADAWWIKDECDGGDTGGSGLSATLADYARLGQFMLEGARIDGRRVVAEAWFGGALRTQATDDRPERGYGYQWWTEADGSYGAFGIFGQMLYVDPARQLVIAQLASWPEATSSARVAARREFIHALKAELDADGNASVRAHE